MNTNPFRTLVRYAVRVAKAQAYRRAADEAARHGHTELAATLQRWAYESTPRAKEIAS